MGYDFRNNPTVFTPSKIKKRSGIYVKRYEEDFDKEIIYGLISLGLSESESKILEYLHRNNEAETSDFEIAFKLPQSVVSVALKKLKKRGWINEKEEKGDPNDPNERPIKKYSLRISFNDIIAELEQQHKEAYDMLQTKVKKVKRSLHPEP